MKKSNFGWFIVVLGVVLIGTVAMAQPKFEPLKIEYLGGQSYKVTCPSGLCDWAPYGELTRRVVTSGMSWKIVESNDSLFGNNMEGLSWTFTVALRPQVR